MAKENIAFLVNLRKNIVEGSKMEGRYYPEAESKEAVATTIPQWLIRKRKEVSYDEERDCKVCDSDHRFDRIGDTYGTGYYVLYFPKISWMFFTLTLP